MNFIITLLISKDLKGNNYNFIIVIVNKLTKIVYYKPVKTIINLAGLVEVIINIIVRYYSLSNSIINYKNALFISKFQLFLYYLQDIKKNFLVLSTHNQMPRSKKWVV